MRPRGSPERSRPRRPPVASKRAKRRKQCGKTPYATQADAGGAAHQAYYRGHRVAPYRCPFCGKFHIGHPPKGVRQAMAARRRARDEAR